MKKSILRAMVLVLAMMLTLTTFVSCDQQDEQDLVGLQGEQGIQGEPGINGTNGVDGKSAYELAVEKGYKGTVDEWLASLVGEVGAAGQAGVNGENAYEIAVKNGYTGTETEWLASLVGSKGDKGDTGAKGDKGDTGAKGDKGDDGTDGITPQLRINETTNMWEVSYDNGTTWTSLNIEATGSAGDKGDKGDTGAKGDKGDDGDDGTDGITPQLRINETTNMWEVSYDNGATWTSLNIEATGSTGDKGDKGDTGAKGDKGDTGAKGDKGDTGATGATGEKGDKGDKGDTGRGIKRMWLDAALHLWVEYDDGSDPIDLGYVGVSTTEPTPTTYTVTFVDYNGTELKVETVESGNSATAPADPAREGYTFIGWNNTFDNVTNDLTVTAQYMYHATEPTLMVSDVTASAGESVTVAVKIAANPGVAGAKLTLAYDSKLSMTNATSGEAFSALDYTPPATLTNGCPFNWDSLDAEASTDGTILTLTFTVSETAYVGEILDVSISYVNGDIYNADLQDLNFDLINGTITIE